MAAGLSENNFAVDYRIKLAIDALRVSETLTIFALQSGVAARSFVRTLPEELARLVPTIGIPNALCTMPCSSGEICRLPDYRGKITLSLVETSDKYRLVASDLNSTSSLTIIGDKDRAC